jgi:hypothetical protein
LSQLQNAVLQLQRSWQASSGVQEPNLTASGVQEPNLTASGVQEPNLTCP